MRSSCSSCKTLFNMGENLPKSMPCCESTVCMDCLISTSGLACPYCSEVFETPPSFATNFAVLDLLERIRSSQPKTTKHTFESPIKYKTVHSSASSKCFSMSTRFSSFISTTDSERCKDSPGKFSNSNDETLSSVTCEEESAQDDTDNFSEITFNMKKVVEK